MAAVTNSTGQIQPEGGAITPATLAQILQLSQFGQGGQLINGQGDIFTNISAAGMNPAATGSDIVLASFTIPANSFDQAARGLYLIGIGLFANNANTKRVKIIFNPATAVVGQTVGAGGITVVDTGAYSTAAATPWVIEGQIFKYGGAGSNTQLSMSLGVILGTAHNGVGGGTAVQLVTAVENAPILVCITGNATTATTDVAVNFFQGNALN